jgi:hypothetical protein
MKIAKEVEGRLRGLDMIFIDDLEIQKFVDNIQYLKDTYKARAVYISYPQTITDPRIQKISDDYHVTVETDLLGCTPPDFVDHVKYTIRDTDILNLRKTDSFKVHTDPNYVHSVQMESFICTVPEDFEMDETITIQKTQK